MKTDGPTFDPLDPPAFGELTDAQKVDIMLHSARGGEVEFYSALDGWVKSNPAFNDLTRYRKKPQPVRDTVLLDIAEGGDGEWFAGSDLMPTHRITFDTIDGKPVCDSIKMEEL